MKFKLLVAATLLSAQSLFAQDLSPAIRNGILEKRVLAAVKDQDFTKAAGLLEKMREIDVVQAPEFYYLDGRVQHAIRRYNASQQSLSTFLETAPATSAAYERSLEILGEIQDLRESFDSIEAVQTCDYYQSSPYDTARPGGIDELDDRSQTQEEPEQSCDEALAIWADHPRMLLNWAHRVPQSRQSEAIAALTIAANQGYEAAYFELGRRLIQTSFDAEEISAAETWLKKAVKFGDPRAPGELGALYLILGKAALAVHWLEMAREVSHFTYNVKLAGIYLNSGTTEEFERAIEILREANDARDQDATFALVHLASRPEYSDSFQSSELYSWSRDLPGSIEGGFDSHLVFANALLAGEGSFSDFERLLEAHAQASGAIQDNAVSWSKAYHDEMSRRIEQLSANRFGAELCFKEVAFYDVPVLSDRYPYVFPDQIDIEAARPICKLAYDASPDSHLVSASLGRVEKAAKNWDQAERLFTKAADETFPAAYRLLGDFYYERAEDLEKDAGLISKSLTALQTGSNLGAASSQLGLAWLYIRGHHGAESDLANGVRMVQELADTGWPPAVTSLGRLYSNGIGVPQDKGKALEYYETAAETGYRWAQLQTGWMYHNKQDYSSAAHWFERAYDQGSSRSATALGIMYYFGRGFSTNYSTAVEYFKEAANKEDGTAFLFLGDAVEKGRGFTQDSDYAIGYYLRANELNSAWAKFELAELFFNTPDYPLHLWRAKYWLDQDTRENERVQALRAKISEALKGQENAQVQYCDRFAAAPIDPSVPDDVAGVSLHDIDLNIVTDVCGKAIEEQPDVARFKFQLGRAYDASEDYNLALEWYTKAADQGHATAQFTLGWIYLNALWIDAQPQVAVEWLTKAADQNLRQAKFHLGKAYYEGTGVDVDRDKGIKLLKEAVAQGDASARKYLEKL